MSGLPIPAAAVLAWLALGQFAADVNLVEVYVTVTDRAGRPVAGLTADDFEVAEDGVPQRIGAFAAGDVPLALALAVDRSWSMAGQPLTLARAGGHVLLGELRPADRSTLLAISTGMETLAPLSTDRGAQRAALAGLTPWGTTGLHDAVIGALDTIEPAAGRRALVLLSDGDDRHSSATAADALDRARRSDVLVYPVAIGRQRPGLFAELAVATGGRSFHAREAPRLAEAMKAIAAELRQQYLIGYTPGRPIAEGPGQWRSIEVRVRPPQLRVRARDGYFTPAP